MTLLMASIKASNPLTGRKFVDVSMATPRCEKAGLSRMKTCDYRGTDSEAEINDICRSKMVFYFSDTDIIAQIIGRH